MASFWLPTRMLPSGVCENCSHRSVRAVTFWSRKSALFGCADAEAVDEVVLHREFDDFVHRAVDPQAGPAEIDAVVIDHVARQVVLHGLVGVEPRRVELPPPADVNAKGLVLGRQLQAVVPAGRHRQVLADFRRTPALRPPRAARDQRRSHRRLPWSSPARCPARVAPDTPRRCSARGRPRPPAAAPRCSTTGPPRNTAAAFRPSP